VLFRSRYISFGLIAVAYVLISSDSLFAQSLVAEAGLIVLSIGAIGCVGVLFDYCQYISGYIAAGKAVKNNNANREHQYNTEWLSMRLKVAFYFMKQVTALSGSLLLTWMMVKIALA